jgi:hypothetical protein
MELLAELHYKLAREQYTTKMDRMYVILLRLNGKDTNRWAGA